MNDTSHIFTAKKCFYAILVIVAVFLVYLAPNSAVNVDEQLHYPHAKKVVNWYFTKGEDKSCLYTPETNLKYYGQSVDNFTALFNRVFKVKNEFLTRHYTGAFFFLLLLLFSGLLAKSVSGSWQLAIVVVFSLVFMPRLAGQAFGNLKDIPFAAGYTAGIFLVIKFLKEIPHPRWKTAIWLGLAIAFTVSVRAGGFILFAYLALGLIVLLVLKPFYLKQIVSTRPVFVRLLGQGAAILIIGYFAGLLFWPYALQNIIAHPLESLRVMEHYKVSIRQIFEGEMLWSTQLPWYYLPKWMLISSPLFVLTGFLLFLWFFLRDFFLKNYISQQLFFEGFILFTFAFPFFYVIGIGSNLYSGVRQMLFILPPLAILSVLGAYRFFAFLQSKNITISRVISIVFLILLIWPFKHQIITFPADYIYFNPVFGGNKKAWGNYEYDYYFHSIKEPVEDLVKLAGEKKITVAMNCNLSNYYENHPNINYEYTRFLERSSTNWDYAIFGLNYIHPHLLKNNLWQTKGILKTYYHKGNPVAVLIERTDKYDFKGISEIKKGNFKPGIKLLELAIENDPNNAWLFVNLLQAKLAENELTGFTEVLENGKIIHPYYEPFFLLEATSLFKQGKSGESLAILNKLLEINPRYLPAKQLLKNVNEKLNETNN